MSYPPGGPGGNEQQQPPAQGYGQGPSGQQPRPQPQDRPPQQGGRPGYDPAATQPMSPPTAEYPTAGPTAPGPFGPPPADPAYQQPYYQPPQQNPYPQQQYPYGQGPDPYAQGRQPYPYQYDPTLTGGYGQSPVRAQGTGIRSRNSMTALLVAVAVVAAGMSVYWFGFHQSSTNGTPVGLGSTLRSTATTGSGQNSTGASASASTTQDVLGTDDQVGQLQELMATMNDPGCRAAFQALITFEQDSATDADDDLALMSDYDLAIASLISAQELSEDATASDAIGQVVTDWKAYTAALAGGGNPPDDTLTADGEELTSACLAS